MIDGVICLLHLQQKCWLIIWPDICQHNLGFFVRELSPFSVLVLSDMAVYWYVWNGIPHIALHGMEWMMFYFCQNKEYPTGAHFILYPRMQCSWFDLPFRWQKNSSNIIFLFSFFFFLSLSWLIIRSDSQMTPNRSVKWEYFVSDLWIKHAT